MKDTIIIGSTGLLGSNLKKYFPNSLCPSSRDLDIKKEKSFCYFLKNENLQDIKTVIHCAALKNLNFCENNKKSAVETNILGTINVAFFCCKMNFKLVYISTDYVFRGDKGNYRPDDEVGPINFYGETKLAGEFISKCVKKHLIIRLSFCEDFFPYPKALCDQTTTKIPVTEAAKKIHELVVKDSSGTIHLPGVKQTVYEFANKSRTDVEKCYLKEFEIKRPKDVSLLE